MEQEYSPGRPGWRRGSRTCTSLPAEPELSGGRTATSAPCFTCARREQRKFRPTDCSCSNRSLLPLPLPLPPFLPPSHPPSLSLSSYAALYFPFPILPSSTSSCSPLAPPLPLPLFPSLSLPHSVYSFTSWLSRWFSGFLDVCFA